MQKTLTWKDYQRVLTERDPKRYKSELIEIAEDLFDQYHKQFANEHFTRRQLRQLENWGIVDKKYAILPTGALRTVWEIRSTT